MLKKLLSLCLVAIMCFAGIGCGSDGAKDAPQYSSDEKFDIGMWVGVSDSYTIYDGEQNTGRVYKLTEEEFLEKYREIASAGFTVAFPGYNVMHDGGGPVEGSYNMKALKAASEVGISHIIADRNVKSVLMGAKSAVERGMKTEEQVVADVKALIEPYTESEYGDALYGFFVCDEPSENEFEDIGFAERIFKQAAPDLMFYVNLFPVIAGGTQLSGTSGSITYDQYINSWLEKVDTDYLSYDHYPLYSDGVNYSLEPSFLYNMDYLQTALREEGKDRTFWTFLQSISYGAKNRPLESKADATFQMYSFLAYGGDGVQWFCYSCPPPADGATKFGENALLDRSYNKTVTYDYVSAANNEVQALMKYYKNFEWQGVALSSVYDDGKNFGYLDNSKNIIDSTETFKGITSMEDAFTGIFKDKEGREGYMVVNFTDPAMNRKNEVTLNIEGKKSAIVVKNGKESIQKISKGKLKLKMEPGEGFFVIPF